MVRTWHLHCRGPGSVPGWGTEMLQALRRGQKKECRAHLTSWAEVVGLACGKGRRQLAMRTPSLREVGSEK